METKSFSIYSEFSKVAIASKTIRTLCNNYNVAEKHCNEIEVSICEALNNIIEHSYLGITTSIIKIETLINKKLIEIKLIDEGITRQKLSKPELNFDPQNLSSVPERGMGLFIINELMNEISYESKKGKNIFTLKKFFSD